MIMQRFQYYLPILGYHRVGPWRDDHVPTVAAETFGKQLQFFEKNRFNVLTLDQIADLFDKDAPFPRKSLAITFDDGYTETATDAWPLLKKHGFAATVFVTPSEVGMPGFMSWDQITLIASEGMDIGCHTMNHSYIPLVPEEQLADELVESKRIIENRIGKPVSSLSYPVGGFTQKAQKVAQEAGYRAAYTTNRFSFLGRKLDRFAVRRIKITERDNHPITLKAKLSGYYDVFRQLRQPA